MPLSRKIGSAPLVLPSEAAARTTMATAAPSTTKASDAPGPHHVRIRRGEAARGPGVEHVIRSASPMALGTVP